MNFERIAPCLYIVRTQAGFKQAAKTYNDGVMPEKGYMQGYPVSYPSLVAFSECYQGYHYVRAMCYPLSMITDAIALHEENYRESVSQ